MVRCNLSVLLAERNLRITKVCKDTGISRTTLTYLSNNYSKGIQNDTLNILCTYLRATPDELISYIPMEIKILKVHRTGENNERLDIEAEITYKGTTQTCPLSGHIEIGFLTKDDKDFLPELDGMPCLVSIFIEPCDSTANPLFKNEIEFLISAFNQLPITFLKDIENIIVDEVLNDIAHEYGLDSSYEYYYGFDVYWDNRLTKYS